VRVAAVIALAASLAAPAVAAPPGAGVLVPGRSLGGVALGETKTSVEAKWGRAYGVCRGCARETWYFNYYAFQPKGAGVEWRDGRVAAVFTLYQPLGWRTTKGLELDDHVSRIRGTHGPLPRTECPDYTVYGLRGRNAVTAFYVLRDRLWAFGLSRPGVPLCRR
jgi:hypothetical protein